MGIRGIFFDAAGVLYTRAEPTSRLVERLLVERGLSSRLSAQDLARQRVLRSDANKGRTSADAYWDRLLQMYGVADAQDRSALVDQISEHSDQVVAIPGAREALARLRDRGFLLGIITDTIHSLSRKRRWLDQVGVSEFIDVLACSTVLGMHKPDPAIYVRAVEQAHLSPNESAFVGHAADELEGARRAGLLAVAVLYDPGARADYYAQSLLDLLDVPIFGGSDR
ncbi:MAG: HAD-IA family hydrolase [Anaerolineae bacterium]|nr:HAD-IA family hydrolase [Anaerolineae bacterium]